MATKKGPTPTRRPLLAAGMTYVDYNDVNLLRTFIPDRGKIALPGHRVEPAATTRSGPGDQERPRHAR